MSRNSSGISIIKDNKILLVHPTNSKWIGTFNIPKGHIEGEEDNLTTALRETKEEIGLDLPRELFDENDFKTVEYRNKHNKLTKKVFYYTLFLNKEIEDKYNLHIDDVINKDNLQLEEVDWAGFVPYKDLDDRLFWRFDELKLLLKKEEL